MCLLADIRHSLLLQFRVRSLNVNNLLLPSLCKSTSCFRRRQQNCTSLLVNAWFPPFRCRSVVPLPLRVRTELVETSFRWRHLNNDQNADWLSSYWRTAKIGLDPICYRMAVTAQQQQERQRHNGIFHVCNVILTALTEFLRNFHNGETAERQRNGGNQA